MTTTLPTKSVADVLTATADQLARDGLHVGDYWPDAAATRWAPGTPTCVIGAIGVAVGLHHHLAISEFLVPGAPIDEVHPALVALLVHLDLTTVEGLFAWFDELAEAGRADLVIQALRQCADTHRWPHHQGVTP